MVPSKQWLGIHEEKKQLRISMIQQRKHQETMGEKLDPNGPMCIKTPCKPLILIVL